MGSQKHVLEEDQALVDLSAWMIRPCPLYDYEYKECSSLKGRFYQYYVDGEFTDCNVWDPLRKNCRKWTRDNDVTAGASIIRHEKQRIAERFKSRQDNDVWKPREERPPVNWKSPLPSHIAEKHRGSYLEQKMPELLEPYAPQKSSMCSIS